jgi:regulator of replication initiation timing
VRLLVFAILLVVGLALPVLAQSSETGGDADDSSTTGAPRALPLGDPGAAQAGAAQDAEAQRERLLKAADQLDAIESNSETTKASLDALKTQLTQLESDNAALKAQVSTLQDTVGHQQDALDQVKADRARDRQAIIDEVSALVATKSAHHARADEAAETPAPRHHHDDDDPEAAKPDDSSSLSPPPDHPGADAAPSTEAADAHESSAPEVSAPADPAPAVTPSATPRPRKGYYHVVAPHETLSLICEAYRDHGVKVTVAEIRHANGLTSKSSLKVGQKLFIPKPGD